MEAVDEGVDEGNSVVEEDSPASGVVVTVVDLFGLVIF